jgi:hypothetical protein
LVCHTGFDPYGLVLENYDAIGRYQTTYGSGTAIDPSAPTPSVLARAATGADGAAAPETLGDVNDLLALMDSSGLFAHCMTANLLKYAAAAPVVNADECVVSEVDSVVQADPTFSNLIRQVALSGVVTTRSVEAAQ